MIKCGAVCGAALFRQLEAGALEKLLALDPATLIDIVAQCVTLKARVVEQDEFDKRASAMCSTSATPSATHWS